MAFLCPTFTLLHSSYINPSPQRLHRQPLFSIHVRFPRMPPYPSLAFTSMWVLMEFPNVVHHLLILAVMLLVMRNFGHITGSWGMGSISPYKWGKTLISFVTMQWVSQMASADGLARVRHSYIFLTSAYACPFSESPKGGPSPSALFARRLMHFCSAEVAAQVSSPAFKFSFHDLPPSAKSPPLPYSPLSSPTHSATPLDVSDDAIEDLADGLDVLLILERAYERALKSHVVTPSAQMSTPLLPAPSKSEPLLTGSSTALLAVLDSAGSHAPTPEVSVVEDAQAHDAVIRIAHLGDCMGMLVREADIVWRSEEMWWAVRCSPSVS